MSALAHRGAPGGREAVSETVARVDSSSQVGKEADAAVALDEAVDEGIPTSWLEKQHLSIVVDR